ncbi:MAG: hypothetical protein DMG32_12215 [Acidobacteria bacterium]|nr:MAG: hypothetical protein DMG32_12215 [Acidobacteriota bacterium]
MWHIRAALIGMGILLALVPGVRADSLQLKNGNLVQGKYLGGTERAVQFEVNGKIRLYGIDEILSISFAAASADGGIPSGNVDPKPRADTELNSAAKGGELGAAHRNQAHAPAVAAPRIRPEHKQYSSRAKLPAGTSRSGCALRTAYFEAKTRVSPVSTRSVRISAPSFRSL